MVFNLKMNGELRTCH